MRHTIISEAIKLVGNPVKSVPWLTTVVEVLAREGWIALLCHGTTALRTAHPHASHMPRETQVVIARARHVLDVLRDHVDDELLQCYCNEVPELEEAWYEMFELDFITIRMTTRSQVTKIRNRQR